MDIMKYLLGNEGGLANRMDLPDGSLPARPIDRLLETRTGPDTVDIPLHVQMQSRGIPYSSWPQEAKDALSPEVRKAYEDDLVKRYPDMYAETRARSRQQGAAELIRSAEASTQPNPYLSLLAGSADNARTRMEAQTASLGQDQRTGMRAGLMGGRGTTWDDVFQQLQIQLSTGQISQEQAREMMDEAMRKNRADRRVNPFG